ncbi:MAG TPA: hypothetical protein VFU57_11750 [Candidatus Acidoferrales bacterium]|nr:hypothetical protein [Candidatus Acidoferrales bacterium]
MGNQASIGGKYSSGVLLLAPLYDFVKEHCSHSAEDLRLERTPLGTQYSKICNQASEGCPEAQGFYLWGKYDKTGLWQNIYLGKAGFGDHKSIRKRIREELKDERCCIWRRIYSADELHAFRMKIHNGKYENEWKRAIRKSGSTHIVWVSAQSVADDQVTNVEADLIESLNPIANRVRPAPPDSLQYEAKEIFGLFRKCIHESRKNRLVLRLAASS